MSNPLELTDAEQVELLVKKNERLHTQIKKQKEKLTSQTVMMRSVLELCLKARLATMSTKQEAAYYERFGKQPS